MGDYNRTSREITLAALPPELMAALQGHIEKYELGSVLEDTVLCVQTVSERIKKGLFAGQGPKSLVSTQVLTPRWLFEVMRSDSAPLYVHSARLADLTVSDYEKSPFYQRVPDSGVQVTGLYTDTSEASSTFIGLGKDAAGEKFKSMLMTTVQNAKK